MADARRAFLTELIDDAGLFPPASLPMEEAAAGHAASRGGPHGWMLGRFVCPAPRLPELAKALPDDDPAAPWRVSVILPPGSWGAGADDLGAIHDFAHDAGGGAGVELVEARLPESPDERMLEELAAAVERAGLPNPVTLFLEVPAADLAASLGAIAEARSRTRRGGATASPGAKLRCGGASADLFPTPARVAAFIAACRDLGVPFKCTAGLHHPFRRVDPATGFMQHGFVNLVGAAVLARAHGLGAAALEEVVADGNPASFSLTDDGFRWRDLEAGPGDIAAARGDLLVAYGSCSFEEPVDDLIALGILPA